MANAHNVPHAARLQRFYAFLAELWIGLYPDSGPTSGPIDRSTLPGKIQEIYKLLISTPNFPQETFEAVQIDYERVTALVSEYESASPKEQTQLLEANLGERKYLTDMTLDYLHKAHK